MQRLYDNQNKQWVEVSDDLIADGVANGRFSYSTDVKDVPVFAPDGTRGSVPAENAGEAYRQGYTPYTQEQSAKTAEAETAASNQKAFEGEIDTPNAAIGKSTLGTIVGNVLGGGLGGILGGYLGPTGADDVSSTALAGGVASGLTGGLSDVALKAASPEVAAARQISKNVNPGSEGIGEATGMMLPISPFGRAAGAATKGVEGLVTREGAGLAEKAAAKIGTGLFEGAITSVPGAVSSAVLGDPDEAAETLLSTLGEGAAIGGGFAGLGQLISAVKPYIVSSGKEVAESVAQKMAKIALPTDLKDLAANPALREVALSPEASQFGREVNNESATFANTVKREESKLRAGLEAETGVESSKARQAGEAVSAVQNDVSIAQQAAREDAAGQLNDLQTARSQLRQQLADTANLDKTAAKTARVDLQSQARELDKQIKTLQRSVADNQTALRDSFKFETQEAQRGADDLLKSNANDIIAARAKAYEVRNANYAKMQQWTDPTNPFIDDTKIALHSPVDPARLFQTVDDAKNTITAFKNTTNGAQNKAADDIAGMLNSLVGKNGIHASDPSSLSHFMSNKQLTGLDLFQAEDAIKRRIGTLYGNARNPGDVVHSAYNNFRDKVFKGYGELGTVANDASDAYRVYTAFTKATNNIKAGNDSVAFLRRTFTDPDKAAAIDAVVKMTPDLVPEFQQLAKTRQGTKAYLDAVDNLETAIRNQHIASSSTKLNPSEIMEAGTAFADPALENNFNRFQSVAERVAKAETAATDQISQMTAQRAALEEQRLTAMAQGNTVPPDLQNQLNGLDAQIEQLKLSKQKPQVPQNLQDTLDSARLAKENQTARVNSIRDEARNLAVSSPTFKLQAEDLKALADKYFPKGNLAATADQLASFKAGYEQLTANGASAVDRYLYTVKGLGGNVSKEMEQLATAYPYQQALERLSSSTDTQSLIRSISKKGSKAVIGAVVGHALGGPMGAIVGSGAASMINGNPVSILRTLTTTEKAIAKSAQLTDTAMETAVKAFNSDAAKKVAIPLTTAPTEKQRRANIKATITALSQLKDPSSIADMVGKAAAGLPQELTASLTSQYSQRIQFLLSKMPVDPLAGKYPLNNSFNATYPSSEIRRFERYMDASEAPLKVIQRIGQGAATPEEIEAVKTLYPRLFNSLKVNLLNQVVSQDKPLSYQQRLILGTTFDVTTDPTMDPQFLARLYQSEFTRLDQQAQATAGAKAENRTKMSKVSTASDLQTFVERTTSGTKEK